MKLLILSVSMMFLLPCQADVYRWVDENGVVVFSQTPPQEGEAEKFKTRGARAPEQAAAARKRIADQQQQVDDYLEDKELATEKQAREKELKEAMARNCEAARRNLAGLEASRNRLTRMPDGSVVRLTEEQRQEKINQSKAQIKEYCE